MVATPLLLTFAIPPLGAPAKGAPFSVNVTVPVLTVCELVTFAVKVTEEPSVAFGNGFEFTVTVVGCPVAGEILRHQPPDKVVVSPEPESLNRKRLHAPWPVAPTNAVWNVLEPAGAASEKLPGSCGAGEGGAGVKRSVLR